MVEAYFDESGTHDGSPVICVAGYLFDSDQALRLDREWADVLERFGIRTFHAVDCAHGTGEFSALSHRERSDLYIRLIGIIKRRMNVGIAVSMSDSDFGNVPSPVYERGGPYLFCALQVLAGVIGWAEKHSFPGKISYVFESGHKHQALVHQAISIMQSRVKGSQGEQNLRLHSVKFGNKPDFRLLQAADILAYEWGKELRRLNLPPNPKTLSTRSSLASLLDQTHIHQHFGASDLHDFFTGNRDELIQRMQRFSDVEEAKLSLLMRLKSIPSVSGR